jgi:Do/DeqQ family serine protease
MDRRFVYLLLAALVAGAIGGGVTAGWYVSRYVHAQPQLFSNTRASYLDAPTTTASSAPAADIKPPAEGELNFGYAAEIGTHSVVFIKTLSNANNRTDEFWSFWDFFGNRGPISSAGSGVILSADGYIVTNNHVVDRADKIEVSLKDKHTYLAKVIGTDPNTDLALLKIEAPNLRPIKLAASENVRIGDWVLAVGNPFNLTYTVTAGIVSAKGRNINVVNSQFPIESFIQTDAAINPGNSGGALLNTQGELVGINTAIASRTGAYNGYGFAIPSSIVRKVVKDLMEHGEVQRAFVGADVVDIDATTSAKLTDKDYSGVLVNVVEEEGAAKSGGLREGDVVLAIDAAVVNSKAEFLEQISLHRPGDKIKVRIKRGGAQQELTLSLTNSEGTLGYIKKETFSSPALGTDIAPLSKVERQRYGVKGGFRLSKIRSGKVAQMGLPEGFVILSINGYVPEDAKELAKLLDQQRGRVTIEGITPDGSRQMLSFIQY